MPTPKQVTRWETSDGQLFSYLESAEQHEKELQAKAALSRALDLVDIDYTDDRLSRLVARLHLEGFFYSPKASS